MADLLKDSSLDVNIDILRTNTLKTHTDPQTVRGRCRAFSNQVDPRGRVTTGSLFVNNIIYP